MKEDTNSTHPFHLSLMFDMGPHVGRTVNRLADFFGCVCHGVHDSILDICLHPSCVAHRKTLSADREEEIISQHVSPNSGTILFPPSLRSKDTGSLNEYCCYIKTLIEPLTSQLWDIVSQQQTCLYLPIYYMHGLAMKTCTTNQ